MKKSKLILYAYMGLLLVIALSVHSGASIYHSIDLNMATLFLIISLVIVLLIVPLLARREAESIFENLPVIQCKATLLVKKTDVKYYSVKTGKVYSNRQAYYYYATFKKEDKTRIGFILDKSQYDLLTEDDNGILSYKKSTGNPPEVLFVAFERTEI